MVECTWPCSLLSLKNIRKFLPMKANREIQIIVSQITALESKIADAKKVMEECPAKKQQILDKWLK